MPFRDCTRTEKLGIVILRKVENWDFEQIGCDKEFIN